MQYILATINKSVQLSKYYNRNNKIKTFLHGPKQSKNQTNIYILMFLFSHKTNFSFFLINKSKNVLFWQISGVLKLLLKIAARLPYSIKSQVCLN